MQLTLHAETDLAAFAAQFGRRLRLGDVIAISGPLGSGKTTLVRAAVAALHGRDTGTSPTFTFWHRYAGDPAIDHIDLFRIADRREVAELGLDEAFVGESIVFVEWWQNAPQILPLRRYEIEIDGAGDEPRTLILREPR